LHVPITLPSVCSANTLYHLEQGMFHPVSREAQK